MTDIFKDAQEMPKDMPDTGVTAVPMPPDRPASDAPVKTVLTYAQYQRVNGWGYQDSMDVRNRQRPRFGHNY